MPGAALRYSSLAFFAGFFFFFAAERSVACCGMQAGRGTRGERGRRQQDRDGKNEGEAHGVASPIGSRIADRIDDCGQSKKRREPARLTWWCSTASIRARGDEGMTMLGNGEQRKKYDLRVDAYGTVDEVTAAIGVARLHTADTPDRRHAGAHPERPVRSRRRSLLARQGQGAGRRAACRQRAAR